MQKTIEELQKLADESIPRANVLERRGSGNMTFSYIDPYYLIKRLNQVFGQGGWAYQATNTREVASSVNEEGKTTASYIAMVQLQVPALGEGCVFCEVGAGENTSRSVSDAHGNAAKSAVTDGLKRAAKNLGMSFGLALYDKDQENVQEEETTPGSRPPKAQPGTGKGHPGKITPVQPRGVGPVNAEPVKTASAPAVEVAGTEEAAPKREDIERAIVATGRAIIGKKAKTADELSEFMMQEFGVDQKQHLTDDQAFMFLNKLKGILNAQVQH